MERTPARYPKSRDESMEVIGFSLVFSSWTDQEGVEGPRQQFSGCETQNKGINQLCKFSFQSNHTFSVQPVGSGLKIGISLSDWVDLDGSRVQNTNT